MHKIQYSCLYNFLIVNGLRICGEPGYLAPPPRAL